MFPQYTLDPSTPCPVYDTIVSPGRLCLTWNAKLEPRGFFCPKQFFFPTHFSWSYILNRQIWKLHATVNLSKWLLIVLGETSTSCACAIGSYTICLRLPPHSHPLMHVHLSPVPEPRRPFLYSRVMQNCFSHLDHGRCCPLPHRIVGRLWGFYGVKYRYRVNAIRWCSLNIIFGPFHPSSQYGIVKVFWVMIWEANHTLAGENDRWQG